MIRCDSPSWTDSEGHVLLDDDEDYDDDDDDDNDDNDTDDNSTDKRCRTNFQKHA